MLSITGHEDKGTEVSVAGHPLASVGLADRTGTDHVLGKGVERLELPGSGDGGGRCQQKPCRQWGAMQVTPIKN